MKMEISESFPMSIFLQNLVSIQLKMSPGTSKFDFRITQRFNFSNGNRILTQGLRPGVRRAGPWQREGVAPDEQRHLRRQLPY